MKTKLLLVVALCLVCTGCSITTETRSARGYMPKIEKPVCPILEEFTEADVKAFNALPVDTQQRLKRNNDGLQLYAVKLETAVDTYNSFAAQVNAGTKAALNGDK